MSKYSVADEVLGLFIMGDALCRSMKDFFCSLPMSGREVWLRRLLQVFIFHMAAVFSLFLSRQKARGSHFSSKIYS